MRVRELLAANAICLLALTGAACSRFEQPLGSYTPDRAGEGSIDLPPTAPPESGTTGSTSGEGGFPGPVIDLDASSAPMPTAGATGMRPSFGWPPPQLADGGMPPEAATECVTEKVVGAKRRRLDMYLMVDNNSTLPVSGAWEDVTAGLDMFVDDELAAGTGVGIRYFGSSCNAIEYAEPTIDVGLLPANARAIRSSTKARRWTASPMLPALEGGLRFARTRSEDHPEWKQIVVLVSDALTQDFTCLYTTANLAESARDGYQGSPSIETHVIGVGVRTEFSDPLDELITRIGAYNTIASAGGSKSAILTNIGDDGSAFRDALHTVRRRATPCEFETPSNVASSEMGVIRFPLAEEVPALPSGDSCGREQGWFYATESLPYAVTLCPATCTWLAESDANQIALRLPCSAEY